MRALLKFTLIYLLISLLPNSVAYGFELAGWYTSSWPRGKLGDYGYGVITTGGAARMSWRFSEKSSTERFFFTEFSYVDFGVETGYQALDPHYPGIGMDVATDYYLMMFSSGISLGKKFTACRPFCDFFGGLSYYSALSRIAGMYRPGNSMELLPESNGMTWHAGIGAGMNILVWDRMPSQAESLLDEVFFNVKIGYIKGGDTEYLNWRSIQDESGTLVFDNRKSSIDLFQLSFGLSFVF